jgi:hypothetical protein
MLTMWEQRGQCSVLMQCAGSRVHPTKAGLSAGTKDPRVVVRCTHQKGGPKHERTLLVPASFCYATFSMQFSRLSLKALAFCWGVFMIQKADSQQSVACWRVSKA